MSKIWDDIKKEGVLKGELKAIVKSICALMSSCNVSMEKAMEMLLIPETDKDELRKLVEEKLVNEVNISCKGKYDE